MSKKNPQKAAHKEAPSPKPSEFDDAVMWAAWLYFVDEMTQSEIAEKIGVSRVTVIKMLNEAKDSGLVNIEIKPQVAARSALSREFAQKFELQAVTIIPDKEDEDLEPRLGKAGAFALTDSLHPGDVIGVAWGRMVLAVARALKLNRPVKDLTVAQVSASPNGLSWDFSPELCSSLMANKLNARSVQLLAPAIVSSAELRDMLLREPSIQKQFDIINAANRVVFGVGDLGKGSTIRDSGLQKNKTFDALIKQGAVAVILGRFINAGGDEIKPPNSDRMIGISLEALKAIPYRLCVTGGQVKTASIHAALASGFVTHLVIDETTAREVLARENQSQPKKKTPAE